MIVESQDNPIQPTPEPVSGWEKSGFRARFRGSGFSAQGQSFHCKSAYIKQAITQVPDIVQTSDNSHYVNLLHNTLVSLDNQRVTYKYASCKPDPIPSFKTAGRVPGVRIGVALAPAVFLSLTGHLFEVTNA